MFWPFSAQNAAAGFEFLKNNILTVFYRADLLLNANRSELQHFEKALPPASGDGGLSFPPQTLGRKSLCRAGLNAVIVRFDTQIVAGLLG